MKWNKLNEQLQVSHYTPSLNETYITQKWRLRSARTNGSKSWIKLKRFLQPLESTGDTRGTSRPSQAGWPTGCRVCVASGSIPGSCEQRVEAPLSQTRRPDEQLGASQGRSAAVSVWVCLCVWANAQYCKVLFGALCTKAVYKCSPCAIHHDPTLHSDYYRSCTLTGTTAC